LELITTYCVRDVYVTVRLDKEFKAFMTMNALAFASTTPLSTLLISGSQKRLLNCLVQFCAARGYICNGIRDPTYASTGSYAGGKVQEAVPGIHKTTCVDFASLYPSIMQCKNLCYSTFVPAWMVEKMTVADREALVLECFEPRPGVKYWFV
jgi:DNA polymerase elongation subunit (family B)